MHSDEEKETKYCENAIFFLLENIFKKPLMIRDRGILKSSKASYVFKDGQKIKILRDISQNNILRKTMCTIP